MNEKLIPASKTILMQVGLWSALIAGLAAILSAQSSQPSPSPSAETGYTVTSSVEAGVRGLEVNGNDDKYRSDLNYKPGFRLFDSSFFIENKSKGSRLFDSLLVTSSGWDADPSGFTRVNVEKAGSYRFDSNVRRVKYFNSLNNHALHQHNADINHTFGDFDLTIFPERQDFRVRLGYSFNDANGGGSYTTRAYGDEFPVTSFVNSDSSDFRAGVDGRLLGFNLSLSHGYRFFEDRTRYSLLAPNLGNNPTNSARLTTFNRLMPVIGNSYYTMFSAQRTFAKKLDFTARFIYSSTATRFTLSESDTGRDNSNNIVTLDTFSATGNAKRPQSRGDVGATYRVTDNFRISDTFTYDAFNISGGNLFVESLFTTTAAGAPRATAFTNTLDHLVTSYKRFMNTLEGDYQFNNRLAFNIGYRFTHREVTIETFDRNFVNSVNTTETEDSTNSTNTVIAGMKIKPVKNWVIYWDIEHGKADNVFTRLANNKFTNFRVRSRLGFNKFALNLSAISKDNTNPQGSAESVPTDFVARIRNRIFSGSLDWTPVSELTFSGGYTFQDLTSSADIKVPLNGVYQLGISQFFIREHYAFFDISARPIKRISVFASYRISDDKGQGDRVSLRPQDIIQSYPMRFQSPEARVAIKLTRNIDWNVGYQYYDYRENLPFTPPGPQPPAQNYSAHLPYTSLRIYFGKGAVDR